MDGRRLIEALLGVYVATLLLPAIALSGLVAVASASLGTILAAGVGLAAAAMLAATIMPNLIDRMASLPAAVAVTLPTLAYPPSVIVADPEGTAVGLTLVGLLALVPGIATVLAAAGVRNRRLREQATEHAVVTTGDDDDDRTSRAVVVAAVAGIAFAAIAVGGAILTVDGFGGRTTLLSSLTGLSSLFFLFDDDGTELAVTDVGLRVDRSITPWDDLGGYRVTDEQIEIERATWWLPSRDFDREKMDDEAAFIDALGEYLPRREEKTEPAAATPGR